MSESVELFQYEPLFRQLRQEGLGAWVQLLEQRCHEAIHARGHGNLESWTRACSQLPACPDAELTIRDGRVTVNGSLSDAQQQSLIDTLKAFRPWRKGPFELFSAAIDTEWRSDLKWERLRHAVELRDRSVLDVGSGNGYYGWRMLEAGANRVIGLDPFLLYVLQHEAVKRYAPDLPNFVLPVGDDCLPDRLHAFDVTFSMGVLYHRTSPIDHLQTLAAALKPGGQLVLETLVIDSADQQVLVPDGRYAKMRNVWFIPSVSMLQLWLKRTGFRNLQVVDVTATSTDEQRRTDWMLFESLSDFLDPDDESKTIEGYPAPLRATILATT